MPPPTPRKAVPINTVVKFHSGAVIAKAERVWLAQGSHIAPGAVLDAFFGEISYRMQGEYRGAAISPFTALQTQFERYYFAVLNWHAAAGFLKFTGTWGWLLAASLAAWAVLRDRSFVPLSVKKLIFCKKMRSEKYMFISLHFSLKQKISPF